MNIEKVKISKGKLNISSYTSLLKDNMITIVQDRNKQFLFLFSNNFYEAYINHLEEQQRISKGEIIRKSIRNQSRYLTSRYVDSRLVKNNNLNLKNYVDNLIDSDGFVLLKQYKNLVVIYSEEKYKEMCKKN